MIAPCESVSRAFLPALKVATARALFSSFNMSQVDIASRLGVTQAQVSKYISGRFSKEIGDLVNSKEVGSMGAELAGMIFESNDSNAVSKKTCSFCSSFNDTSGCYFIHLKALYDNAFKVVD